MHHAERTDENADTQAMPGSKQRSHDSEIDERLNKQDQAANHGRCPI